MAEESSGRCLPVGTLLKQRYAVQRSIYISNLSIVYQGFDQAQSKICVIKEFFPTDLVLRDLDKKTVYYRKPTVKTNFAKYQEIFLNEALILKGNCNRGIVGYIDHFTENGTAYIILDYCSGKTLEAYISEEKDVRISHFLKHIFLPILQTVEEIHRRGVIHRDIKPNNIMIDENGSPVLIDFGCAVPINASEKKHIFVTPGFSPLEFYSERSQQGKYSDIYSLAATLYYYLCGKAPSEVSTRVIVDELENIREYNRIISPLLSKVIMKNLSLNYRKRNASLRPFKICVALECLLLKLKRVG